MKAPCKDCPDRQVGCHSTCEKYITFAKEKRQQNETIKKAKHEENLKFSRMAKKYARLDKKYW